MLPLDRQKKRGDHMPERKKVCIDFWAEFWNEFCETVTKNGYSSPEEAVRSACRKLLEEIVSRNKVEVVRRGEG